MATRQGHQLIEAIDRPAIESLLNDPGLNYLVLLGHGTDDRFHGQDGRPVLDLANVRLLRGKTVFAVACYTANRLGQEAMGAGARAYIGYTASFWVWSPQTAPRSVANEWIGTANVALSNSLLEGRTYNFAVAAAHETYTQAYLTFKDAAEHDVLDADAIASTMLRNRNTLVLSASDHYATIG